MDKMEEIHQARVLSYNLQEIMGDIFPTFIVGTKSFIDASSNPNILAAGNRSLHVLNAALIVYLFTMWDSYTIKNCVDKYFRPDEKKLFHAFKHIRNVAV